MIEELVKIHDKFSVEIKLGFNARRKQEVNDFSVNTWIFIPNSLDINRTTYLKTDFYRDLKSNIRLDRKSTRLNSSPRIRHRMRPSA